MIEDVQDNTIVHGRVWTWENNKMEMSGMSTSDLHLATKLLMALPNEYVKSQLEKIVRTR